MGKHKPIYDKSSACFFRLTSLMSFTFLHSWIVDCGDYVVVTNARNVQVSGRKDEQLVYRRHTMFPGGLKEAKYKDVMEKQAHEVRFPFSSSSYRRLPRSLQIIVHAVSGMLPKNKLRDRRLARLKVFGGSNMGIYRNNILKRWEDGTLTDEYILKLDPKNVSPKSAQE